MEQTLNMALAEPPSPGQASDKREHRKIAARGGGGGCSVSDPPNNVGQCLFSSQFLLSSIATIKYLTGWPLPQKETKPSCPWKEGHLEAKLNQHFRWKEGKWVWVEI